MAHTKTEQCSDYVTQKILEAREALRAIGFHIYPKTPRSELVLLSLLNLSPSAPWSDSTPSARGPKRTLDFLRENYQSTSYERESIRDEGLSRFVEAGLATCTTSLLSTNDSRNVYQIVPEALELFQTFRGEEWPAALNKFKSLMPLLKKRNEAAEIKSSLNVPLGDGRTLSLSPGGQNPLIAAMLTTFRDYHSPESEVFYVGDARRKWHSLFPRSSFTTLGINLNKAGKMPDMILLDRERHWLILMEAVKTTGQITEGRRKLLKGMFANDQFGLIFVNAFPDRKTFRLKSTDIAWESEVWIAEEPEHLIHFNGHRFLGPYQHDLPRVEGERTT